MSHISGRRVLRQGRRHLFLLMPIMLAGSTSASVASGLCTFLTGEARRLCMHAEAVTRSEQNRAAADASRDARRTEAVQRENSQSATPIFTSKSPTRTWGNKLRFADPPTIWKQSRTESERTDKQLAIDWVNRNDPSYVALRSAIERIFPLWVRANGTNTASVSFSLHPGRFPGELDIAFGNGGIQAQMVEGSLCLGNANTLYKSCDDIPSSMAEADRIQAESNARNARNRQETQQAKQEVALVIAGSRTRRPGSPLNAEDEACMKTFRETYQEYAEGQCASGYYSQLNNGSPGPYVCTKHNGEMVTRVREYEKNVCRRPISFRDQCGSTIWGNYTIQPGARFDRKFSYPCGRVY